MKELISKVEKMEAGAKRTLVKKQAKKLEHQAAKFREDSLKLSSQLTVAGRNIYKSGKHPVYEELIEPLLERAAGIANFYGFNALFQVQTPVEGMPHFTSCLGTIDSDTVSPTMKGCVELIEKRPVIGKVGDSLITEPRVEPLLPKE